MKCQRCESTKILSYSGKTKDMNSYSLGDNPEREGYVPSGLNIGSGDYVEFNLCLDCGQVQGEWPVKIDVVCRDCGVDIMDRGSWEGVCYDCAVENGWVDTFVPGERGLPDNEKTMFGN